MFPYKDIPHEIKESVDINSLRRIAPKWDNQKILSKYLESYSMGIRMITEHRQKDPDYIPTRIQYLFTTTYYVLRKELLKRMSPLVSRRSEDVLLLDNKKILDKLDACLLDEDVNQTKIRRYLFEIRSRME